MRDFPIFTTDFGVSSLFLKEIPYKSEAYIRIRDVQSGYFREHLTECAAFCRMAGAERIYAAAHEALEGYPVQASILEMRGMAWVDPEKLKNLFPVTKETVSTWRTYYNAAMQGVDHAGTLESREEGKICSGGAYFVHDQGELLGIGWVEKNTLVTVAAVRKGAGEAVMHTLMSLIEGETMILEVASTNTRAIRLYEKLGFLKTGEKTRWHDVTRIAQK